MDSAEERNDAHEAAYKHQLHHQQKPPRDASSPFYHQRLSSFAPPLHEFETSPAYMLEWDPQKQCRRTIISNPDVLRELISGMDKDGTVTLVVVHGLPANYVDILRNSEEFSIDSAFLDAHAARRSYCSRSGLTLPRRRGHSKIRSPEAGCFAQFEYPELIQGFDHASMAQRETHPSPGGGGLDGRDLMATGPKVLPLTAEGKMPKGMAAAFYRASLWISSARQQNPRAGVLFLDKPLWRDAAPSPLRKASFPTAKKTGPVIEAQRPRVVAVDGYDTREEEEVPCLEDLVYEMLCHNANEDTQVVDPAIFVADVVSEIVYNHWLELFEVLAPPTASQPKLIEREVSKSITLYWHMVQSLERNADATTFYADHHGRIGGTERASSSGPDWKTLLSRAKRRIALLNASPGVPILLPIPTPPENPPTCVTLEKVKPPKKRSTAMNSTAKVTNISLSRTTTPGNNLNRIATYASLTPQRSRLHRINSHQHATSDRASANNQRALERISYLGGILLPFPIVSGILSMGDEYGPGAPKFYIFWAVVIPLSIIACLIIYADIVRKAEVWVEVATERVVVSSLSSAAAVFPYPLPLPTGAEITDTMDDIGRGVTIVDVNRSDKETEEAPPHGFFSLKSWRWWIGKLIWQKHRQVKRQMEMRHCTTHDHGVEVHMNQEESGSHAYRRGQTDEEQTIGINPFVGNTGRTGFYPPPDAASPTAQPPAHSDLNGQRPSVPPSFQLPTATGSHYGDSTIQENGQALNDETVDTTPITPLSPGHVHLMMMPPGMTLAQTTTYPDTQRHVGFDADTETEPTQLDESEEESASGEALPRVILEMTPSNGIKPKAWKRQELGWYGAVKRIVNPKQLRALEDVPVGVEAHERQNSSASGIRRRKTRTY